MKPIQPNLVSTIIPVRNRASLLVEAVNSVLAQTYRPIEIIIVDDGSTDETPAAGQSLASAHAAEIQFLSRSAEGVAAARNAGLDQASGSRCGRLRSRPGRASILDGPDRSCIRRSTVIPPT